MDSIIKTIDVHKSFPLGNHEILEVLKGVDMDVPPACLTILKGRSGSGKTTLLNILSMLDDPTSGQVIIDGRDVGGMSTRQRETMRRYNIGFVFQSVALVPIMSAYENVDFALKLADYKGDRDARIREVLSIVGLEKRMSHMPSQMSGGEQQRVAIARAVAHKPKIIFADEPTGALDTNTGLGIIKLFKELIAKEGITIVMTTHDPNLMVFGDAVYEMEDGELKYVPAEQ
ncbi:MAG: ABC transporter ATP-binding protein [Lachnospiraceae bacterium]|nr:ABC transporter ATP-binding protein [Lachnospiraceae bacterium]MBR4412264.1 ABC transporter ATP-binding protein [Lachnospiraceae bacterium]MBR5066785.1 ABC transporter ATP-binding protein [Lachnospiraceae bacterium]MBR5917365.1 ABC transporter ATP-binding protein [Lachnospiraceae bacterium]